jgi:flagellar assembly protein FliH
LSKLIHQARPTSTVFIGEKQRDLDQESKAADKLSQILPLVSFVTDDKGAMLIPIQEVSKIEEVLVQEKRQAFDGGYTDGHQKGLTEGLAEARKVLEKFDRAIADAVSQREALLEEAKQKVLDLVIQISRKVTYDAVRIDPETNLALISGVIDGLIDRSKLKIKVNPEYLPVIEQGIDRFMEGSTSIKEIAIEPDPRVRYGGCFIETPTGDIDARLESQFEVIEDALRIDEERP